MIPGKQYTPELVLATAWRRKWLILIPAVLIAAVSCGVTYWLPDLYRSEALIRVVPQRVPETYIKSVVTTRINERLQSIIQEVRSRTRLEGIIQEFNLYPERRKTDIMQDIVDDMNDNIHVDIIQGDVFRVAFTADDARVAQQVTSRLSSFFIDESVRDRTVLADGTSTFLETELASAKQKLVANEQKLAAYRQRHNGELPTQVEANLQGMHNAETQLQIVRAEIQSDRDLMALLDRRIEELVVAVEMAPPAIAVTTSGPATPTPAQELAAAEEALQALLTRVKETHPDVGRLKRAIEELRQKAAASASDAPLSGPSAPADPRVKQLEDARSDRARVERSIAQNTAEQTRLSNVIGNYQRRMEAAPVRDTELTELLRDYKTYQSTYDSLLNKSLDSQISANLERQSIGEQFRILDPARVPERPTSPDRPRLYWMGVLLALGVGLGLAGIAEYLDRGLRSEEDIRLALGLPVLASIPVIGTVPPSRRRKQIAAGSAALLTVMVAAIATWAGLR